MKFEEVKVWRLITPWHPHRFRLWFSFALLGALTVALVGFGGPPQAPVPSPEPQSVGPVANLVASAEGQTVGAVRLTWTAAENAQAHFIVYLKSSDNVAGNLSVARMQPFNGTEGVLRGLEPGASYDFIAIGMRWNWINYGVVWGSWSQWVSAMPPSGSAATDRTALIAFYNATDGPNWADNSNWLSDAPISAWHGVTTNGNGHVIKLDLSGNGLTGVIPPELGSLTNLEELHLYHNQLTGAIPPELGGLANLEELRLWGNRLTGEIPPSLGNLANLEWLGLAWNELSGPIPSSLGSLADLQGLYLRHNRLRGPIPSSLGSLANLEWLDLNWNELSGGIPIELSSLANLEGLYLSYNQLSGPIPSSLNTLVNLETVVKTVNISRKGPSTTSVDPPQADRRPNSAKRLRLGIPPKNTELIPVQATPRSCPHATA